MITLKDKLIDFGCSSEFVEIAMGYTQFYNENMETEAFIEYVEVEHAKVEEAEALKEREKQIYDASSVLAEFADDEELE